MKFNLFVIIVFVFQTFAVHNQAIYYQILIWSNTRISLGSLFLFSGIKR